MPQPEPADLNLTSHDPDAPLIQPDLIADQPKGVAFADDIPPKGIAPEPELVDNPANTDLAKILVQARAAHVAYRQAAPRITNGQKVEDRDLAYQALSRALELRETAEILDPDHSDPAWKDDVALKYDQRNLLLYYRQKREQYLR